MSEHGRNSVSGEQLRAFIERVERIREDKRTLGDDEAAVFAEAKSAGYTPRYMRAIIKLRALPPSQRQEDEAMMDLYLGAVGMAQEPPLFRAVGLMATDLSARESVIEAMKLLAPENGEIIIKCGGAPVRVWRDKAGFARAEEFSEDPLAQAGGKARPARGERGERSRPEPPDVDPDGAEELGREAARADQPIIANPFPWDDKRRARWDLGWRLETGSDGMGPDK